MAEIFGAVGTAISLLDLILKRVKTVSRFKKDAEGAVAEVTRLSQELERRTELLSELYAELRHVDSQDPEVSVNCLRGSGTAMRGLKACEHEIQELQPILVLFESRLQDGRSWWTLLTTKLEFAWKKEDVNELYRNVASANTMLADALQACQLYLQRASLTELRGIRTQDLPPMQSALNRIRVEDLPHMSHAIAASISLGSDHVVRELRAEAQSTRTAVLERGWATTTEIEKLETAIGRMLAANRVDIAAALLPPMKQHVDHVNHAHVEERRVLRGGLLSSNTASQLQEATSQPGILTATSALSSRISPHMKTKPISAVRWEKRVPVGLGRISLRREVRQRVLIRIRRRMSETDTSIDTETTWIVGFIPSSWLFGSSFTGINWKFSFRTTRRLNSMHPAWDAARDNDVDAIIEYFREGSLSINDVDEEDGDSLLHVAAKSYSYELCEWLVDNGADSHAANDMLETAVFSLIEDTSGDDFSKRYPAFAKPSYKSYDPLMNLLIEKCQLDPSDSNLDGFSVLESDRFSDNMERFSRLFTLSMALCTEPEGHRIKTLFNSIAVETKCPSTVLRLRCLLEEYQHTGLPEEDTDGRKWWHTADFMWRLAERLGGTAHLRNGFRAEKDHQIDLPGGWVEEQLSVLMRTGTDLHVMEGNQTLLDYFISHSPEFISCEIVARAIQPARLVRWLGLLQRSGMNLSEYMRQEQQLHPGGELMEDIYHTYHEYPVFTVNYKDSNATLHFTRAVVVVDHAETTCMPGSWEFDPELQVCEQRGLSARKRAIGLTRIMTSGRQRIAASCAGPPTSPEDGEIYDWELTDGRKGNMYPLWKISTGGFCRGDYSLETALIYIRDLIRHPIYVEYASGWLYYPKVVELGGLPSMLTIYRESEEQDRLRKPDRSLLLAWMDEFAGLNDLIE